MARPADRLPDNAAGEFYVDRSCIDCDTCTRVAPGLFAPADDHSFVARQPRSPEERLRALMALVSCPTASIGTTSRITRSSAGGSAASASCTPTT
jgi:ferredoxin